MGSVVLILSHIYLYLNLLCEQSIKSIYLWFLSVNMVALNVLDDCLDWLLKLLNSKGSFSHRHQMEQRVFV